MINNRDEKLAQSDDFITSLDTPSSHSTSSRYLRNVPASFDSKIVIRNILLHKEIIPDQGPGPTLTMHSVSYRPL